MAKAKKKSKNNVKKYLSCYYMAKEPIGVREIAEIIKEQLPQVTEKMEFWEAEISHFQPHIHIHPVFLFRMVFFQCLWMLISLRNHQE